MTPAIWDEQWIAFQRIAEEQEKLPSSPIEWLDAFQMWRYLDGHQRQAAIDYLTRHDGMETTHSTVQSYLRKQKFLRPTPKARKPKVLDGALARLREGR